MIAMNRCPSFIQKVKGEVMAAIGRLYHAVQELVEQGCEDRVICTQIAEEYGITEKFVKDFIVAIKENLRNVA
jgi:hypothetical protein